MSRSGYNDDFDDIRTLAMWRGQVMSAALGCLGKARGLDMTTLDPEDPDAVTAAFGVAPQLIREITYMNDETYSWRRQTPEERWKTMLYLFFHPIATTDQIPRDWKISNEGRDGSNSSGTVSSWQSEAMDLAKVLRELKEIQRDPPAPCELWPCDQMRLRVLIERLTAAVKSVNSTDNSDSPDGLGRPEGA